MKIVINTIAVIVLSVQFFSFAFNALNQKKPESTLESLCNYFNFTALLCSLLSVVIFIALYNFNSKFLKKRFPNCIMLIIVLLGIYVGIIVAVIAAVISVIIHVIIEKVIAEGVNEGLPSIDPMVKVATNQVI